MDAKKCDRCGKFYEKHKPTLVVNRLSYTALGGSPVVRIGCMGHGITFSGTIICESPQYIDAVNDAFAIALTELNSKLTPTKKWYLEECDELPKTVKLYPTPSEEEI